MKTSYVYEWDDAKAQANQIKHEVSFDAMYDFDWDSALTLKDQRWAYGEDRFYSFGYIKNRLYAVVWTIREKRIRIISLRKANNREREFYDTESIH